MKLLFFKIKNLCTEKLLTLCTIFINKYTPNEVDSAFSSLMPKDNADISCYETALDYSFQSPEKITNIAISGSYGSGKSSIIGTYEKKHPEIKFLHISLAHFYNDNIALVNETEISNLLEGKILNQLIRKIKPAKIKESNFKVKYHTSFIEKLLQFLSISYVILSLLYAFFYKNWKTLVDSLNCSILQKTTTPKFTFILVSGCLVILLISISLFVSKKGIFKYFKKIEIKDLVGIEIFDSETDSSFDKYLNEVVYLFESSKADAIVFEDLDRYGSLLIFEKLREINHLINTHSKHPLRFFYLIKDDMFTYYDRSKFFDFIIPVIPIVDTTNASDMLSKLLKNAGLQEDINSHFIKALTFYVSDMRLLTNIVNEYQIYKRAIKLVDGYDHATNQFAMIVYKNLFPEDFHALQSGHGYVYLIFEQKNELCKNNIQSLNKKKEELLNGIKIAEKEHLISQEELAVLYFPLNDSVLQIDGENISSNINRAELINRIINSKKEVCVLRGGRQVTINVQNLVMEMEALPEYQRRYKDLKLKLSEQQTKFYKDIDKIEKEILQISTKRLVELISATDISTSFWKSIELKYNNVTTKGPSILEDRNYNLIKYLISNGYLNENYDLYCSYFYSDELSLKDRNFVLSVYDRKDIPYTYTLDSPKSVLNYINNSAFLLESINNFDLFQYVIENNYTQIIETWFTTLNGNEKNGHNFILSYWRLKKSSSQLINYIVELEPEWIRIWVSNNLLNVQEFVELLCQITEFCPEGSFLRINSDGWLTKKISTDPYYLTLSIAQAIKYGNELKSIGVLFSSLEHEKTNEELLLFIYRNDMYEINYNNIVYIIRSFTKFDWGRNHNKFFTFLYNNIEKPISKYIFDNVGIFLPIYLNFSVKKFCDEQNVILWLLNNNSINIADKIEYMRRSTRKINQLQKIYDKKIWSQFLNISAFKNTWNNLIDYYSSVEQSEDEISEQLAIAMSTATGITILRFTSLNERIGTDVASDFRKKFIMSSYFSTEIYKKILNSMTFVYNNFAIKDLLEWQLISLIQTNTIGKTKENYDFIKVNYPDNLFDFVFYGNSKRMFKLIQEKDIKLNNIETLSLLSDHRCTDEFGLMLLDLLPSVSVSLKGKNYSDELSREIIQAHLSLDDLPWLLSNFHLMGSKTKNAIISYALKNPSVVTSAAKRAGVVPTQLYASLVEDNPTEVGTLLDLRKFLSDPLLDKVCTSNKSPSFHNTKEMRIILDFFKKQDWISSYNEKNNMLRVYPKRKTS